MTREYVNLGEAVITSRLQDRVARAALLEGDAYVLALDSNARLVTALREAGIWPARYAVEEFR